MFGMVTAFGLSFLSVKTKTLRDSRASTNTGRNSSPCLSRLVPCCMTKRGAPPDKKPLSPIISPLQLSAKVGFVSLAGSARNYLKDFNKSTRLSSESPEQLLVMETPSCSVPVDPREKDILARLIEIRDKLLLLKEDRKSYIRSQDVMPRLEELEAALRDLEPIRQGPYDNEETEGGLPSRCDSGYG